MKTFKQFMEGAMDGNIFKGKLKPMMNPDGEYPKDLPFIRDKNFPYKYAFKDQFTSRQYVHQIVDKIINLSLSNEIGIKHIIGKYQSVYDLAKQSKPDVKPINTPEKLKNILPMNLNLK